MPNVPPDTASPSATPSATDAARSVLPAAIEQRLSAAAGNILLLGEARVRHAGLLPELSPDFAHPSANRECVALLSVRDSIPDLDLILGDACRQHSSHLVVEHVIDGPVGTALQLSPARFFAFGFRRLDWAGAADGEASAGRSHWYEFRLAHYKPPPDWLNARFWANPERFDLQDDPPSADP